MSKTTGTTTEAFTFDAFDRMIRTAERDFTYDALDRPVQAGTARMRYDGFSDEVVSDGTQFFGRSASDGLLSVGYETTKRLVLADRHGDIVAGFDPADTALAAGLPDTRTFDPFGNSTNASGLKYRVGYQGDWTDPRSGDVNQGARWYNPESATFNSRDTITHNAGTPSSVLNLYAYGAGNPVTLNDPDGHRPFDPQPECVNQFVGWAPGGGDTPIYKRVCNDPPKPPKDDDDKGSCKAKGTCPTPGEGKGDGDGGGCKKNCGIDKPTPPKICKTQSCRPKPPSPPVCDAQCHLQKKIKKEREQLEHDAKNVPQPPPGDPSCTNGNPALCPVSPTQPAAVVGAKDNLTDATSDWSDQQHQNALNQVGSVVATVSSTGSHNWFHMGMGNLPMINSPCGGNGSQCAGGAGGGGIRGGAVPVPAAGPAIPPVVGIVIGATGIGGQATVIFLEMLAGRGGGGGMAQPPGDGGDAERRRLSRFD
ncbi:RHS repeat domain-containing protein [Kribbella swartbergensis]